MSVEGEAAYAASVVLTVLCVVCLLVQFITAKIEKAFSVRSIHVNAVLNKIYKSIMILCICTLLLFIEDRQGWFITGLLKTSHSMRVSMISVIQYVIVAWILGYIVWSVYLLAMCAWWTRTWAHFEAEGPNIEGISVWRGRLASNDKEIPKKKRNWHILSAWMRGPSKKKYHALRVAFIVPQNLNERFDFAVYSVQCLRGFVVDIIGISSSTWFALAISSVVSLIVRASTTNLNDWDMYMLLIEGYILCIICLAIAWKTTLILRTMAYDKELGGIADAATDSLLGHAGASMRHPKNVSSRNDEERMFWFSSPWFMKRLLQLMTVMFIEYVSLLAVYYTSETALFWALAVIPPVILVFVLPRCIVSMALATSMGRLASLIHLRKTRDGEAESLDFL